jgi:5-methylcytosine-specific restriction endonuclease McrA
MTQGAEQRRLTRLAIRMNRRAAKSGVRGTVVAEDLARIVASSDFCHYCGVGLERGRGSFDHAIALDRGGLNVPSNIVRACYTCNRTKFDKTPEEMAAYATLRVNCRVCGKEYHPRYAEWINGRARTCSRSCAAKSRFVAGPRVEV